MSTRPGRLPMDARRLIRAARELSPVDKLIWEEILVLSSDANGCYASSASLAGRLALSARVVDASRARLQRAQLLVNRRAFRRVEWFATLPPRILPPERGAKDDAVLAAAVTLDRAIAGTAGALPKRAPPPAAGRTPPPQLRDDNAADDGATTTPLTPAGVNPADERAPIPLIPAGPTPLIPAGHRTASGTDAPCPPLPGENGRHVKRDDGENSEPLTPEQRRQLFAEMKRDLGQRLGAQHVRGVAG